MSKYQNRLKCEGGCNSGSNGSQSKATTCKDSTIKEIAIFEDKVIVYYKDCTYSILEPSVLTQYSESSSKCCEELTEKISGLENTLAQQEEKIAEKASQSDLKELTDNIVSIKNQSGEVSFKAINKDFSTETEVKGEE